jgi:hypothetical protein
MDLSDLQGPRERLYGRVVDQQRIRLYFESPLNLKEPVTLRLRRSEFGLYEFPYQGVDSFLATLRPQQSKTFEVSVKPGDGGCFEYADNAVRQDFTYVYWVQSPGGHCIAGPLALKVRNADRWWSQARIEQTMDRLRQAYPKYVDKVNFGQTVQGNPINGLVVGNPENCLALVGYSHAGESGAELQLYAIEKMLERHIAFFSEAGILTIPAVNIDARNRLIEGVPGYLRKNSHGVDLNRNYPSDWDAADNSYGVLSSDPFAGTYRGPAPASEPETQAVIGMIENFRPKVLFDYHWMGTITGCWLLSSMQDASLVPDLNLYAERFYEGFEPEDKDLRSQTSGSSIGGGTICRYCISEHKIPAFLVEGGRRNAVLERTREDMATVEDLNLYQRKHFRAVRCLVETLCKQANSLTDGSPRTRNPKA